MIISQGKIQRAVDVYQEGITKLGAPKNVTARHYDPYPYIYITWDAVPGATSYRIYRSNDASGTYHQIDTSNSYDKNPLSGANYYKVKAYADTLESEFSDYAFVDNTTYVIGVSLNKTNTTLTLNEVEQLTATVLPNNATNKTVNWKSSHPNVATVNAGLISAVSVGTTTITVTTDDGYKIASCVVSVKDGVRINGIIWAKSNVAMSGIFVTNPEDAGLFYQWSRKIAWPATGNVTGWDTTIPTDTTWEKTNDPSPAGWRVPTGNELASLIDTKKVTKERISINGINGHKFTDISTGKSIFLPDSGYRMSESGSLNNALMSSCYWSSTRVGDGYSGGLFLGIMTGIDSRNGFKVRPVAE